MNWKLSRFILLVWLCLCVGGCTGSSEPTGKAGLSKQFTTFFGFEPPPSVTELHAKSVWIGDSMVDWLSFKCDAPMFDRIVRTEKYEVAESSSYSQIAGLVTFYDRNPNAPSWWPNVQNTKIPKFYYLSRPYVEDKTPVQSSETYLWRNEETGVVYAYYAAWR